ncbi:conserved hypothetical protein [Gordonia bronchialis DSM 43247]|uniref:Acyl-CoA thioesterase-like C-terminal domain-containing protein n=1 Tax=Gordonia bronchialis (strain ATCC 25592 / DSM 43247 / BCRC 13721 / JCM 3198 / KCTC 3076 / NBRC 16047 / NCTC 10667) TaxID=526226 RepID=D0L667_GORB4|nr:acyl-CoA thioesterase domain-containing protein [Gordonia bronchialis]ACY23553.1 conserved hypothetical protein [Gordonia bronchialis DSM 43247]MCC3321718.1 thioesterase family protein [Gordonia bronchialis]STQ66555.1 Protein of uncharacterised function (DUF3705) [Gordonia bronchialis]
MATIGFFDRSDDDRLFPTRFSRSMWAPGTLNGPAVCAIAARHAEVEYGETGFRPARFTIDLFKAAREIPTTTRGRLTRAGGRIRVAEVDVVQFPADGPDDGVIVARSTTVFLRDSVNPPGDRWSRPDDAVTFRPPTVGDDDYFPRFASDVDDVPGDWDSNMGNHQNGHRKRLWSRAAPAVAGESLTPFQQAVISAESTSLVCNWGSTGIGFINCDLTVALSRLPVGARIGVEADSHVENDGISVSTSGLYDEHGMFGTGLVTAVNNAAAEIDFTSVDTSERYREA